MARGSERRSRPTHAAARAAADPTVSGLRILLAEDNLVNQKVALRLLEQLGYRVDVVGRRARGGGGACARRRYDVVLMDVQMPVWTGSRPRRSIRAHEPARSEQPWIVAMTANALPRTASACLAAGMDDYLSKPVRSEALAAALAATGSVNGQDEPGGPREQ